MNVRDAVIQVLQQAETALHAKDIAEQIMATGLWQSGGKTPDATVSAWLYSDIKSNGDNSPFVKVGPQTFALRIPTEMSCDAGPDQRASPYSMPIVNRHAKITHFWRVIGVQE